MAIRRFSTASISTGNSKSTKLWDQETFQSGMFALATVALTSTASSIVFSDIPSSYTHLELRGIARVTGSSNEAVLLRFNSDSGSNYAEHHLVGNGSSAVAGANSSYANGAMYWGMGVPFAANTFGANVTTILDYANTSKYKTVRSFDGFDANGSGGIELVSSLWQSTSAITSITLIPNSSVSFAQYTHFALYGIRTA